MMADKVKAGHAEEDRGGTLFREQNISIKDVFASRRPPMKRASVRKAISLPVTGLN
jgi:hypothetical protein